MKKNQWKILSSLLLCFVFLFMSCSHKVSIKSIKDYIEEDFSFVEDIAENINNVSRWHTSDVFLEGQDADCFGGYTALFYSDFGVSIKDMRTNRFVSGKVFGDRNIVPHCNSVSFGNNFADDGDCFPTIYVNAYNSYDLPLGTLFNCRLFQLKNGCFEPRIIQTIHIDFVDDLNMWPDKSQIRPFGNFAVNSDGFLYSYVPDDIKNLTRVYKFAIPPIKSNIVYLSKEDALDYFEINYISIPQGCSIKNNYLFMLSGWGNNSLHGSIQVLNLNTKSVTNSFDFSGAGFFGEPEAVFFYENKMFVTLADKTYYFI